MPIILNSRKLLIEVVEKMNGSFTKLLLTVLIAIFSTSFLFGQSGTSSTRPTPDQDMVAEQDSEKSQAGETSVINKAMTEADTQNLNNWVGDVVHGQAGGCNCCCNSTKSECGGIGRMPKLRLARAKAKFSGIVDRLHHAGVRSHTGLGFAVGEVQYGANAGSPSFGVISHGPWYNGETFGPRLLQKHGGKSEGCKSSQRRRLLRRQGALLPGPAVAQKNPNDCQCQNCQGSVMEFVPAGEVDEVETELEKTPAKEVPVAEQSEASTASLYPLNGKIIK